MVAVVEITLTEQTPVLRWKCAARASSKVQVSQPEMGMRGKTRRLGTAGNPGPRISQLPERELSHWGDRKD